MPTLWYLAYFTLMFTLIGFYVWKTRKAYSQILKQEFTSRFFYWRSPEPSERSDLKSVRANEAGRS